MPDGTGQQQQEIVMRSGGQQQSGGVGILATMRRRRGSILVLVLGTIALMTVLAVFYAAIGKSDRRAGRAFMTRAATDDVPRQVADYIASIIAEDVFSVYPSPERLGDDGSPQWGLRRETWDYPSIDPNVRSAPPAAQRNLVRFRPSGSVPVIPTAPPSAQSQTPAASDPFLASPEPVDLLGGERTFPGLPNTARDSEWIRRLDWPAMSNIAPDGRAVNLFILREDFNAPPTTQDNGISSGLLQPQADAQTMGATRPLTGDAADTNRPYDWFTNQVNTARRVDSLTQAWDDPNFLLYQYADASGDGVIDSRWVELIDATDPFAPSNIITGDPSFRWFIAARVTDLSGRVNVNTAGDFVLAPEVAGSLNAFAGATPADIDLLRLLRMEDAYEDTRAPGSAPGSQGGGYSELPQPSQQNVPGNYTGYTESASSPGNDVRGRVGTAAYNLLILARFTGAKAPADVIGSGDQIVAFFESDYFDDLRSDPQFQQAANDWFAGAQGGEWTLTPSGRLVTYIDYGRLVGSGRITDGTQAWSMPALFGLSDLSGLLTYEGLNDSATQTTLESLFDGRSLQSDRFGPLRSLRTTRLERSGEQRDAQLLFAANVRRWVTTLSGHRPLRSTVLELSPQNEVTPRELSLRADRDAKIRMPSSVSSITPARTMFQIYADALMPYASGPSGSWNEGPSQQHTLHYGYRGPELALRTAAHLAANLWGAGSLGGPSFATLLLDGTFQTELANAAGNPLPSRNFPWAAWNASSPGQLNAVLNLFNADEERLAQGGPGAQDITARAVNVYGISPQPFITEVASYYVYADAERDWDVDQDFLRRSDWQGVEPQPPLEQYEVTIDSSLSGTNPDAVFSFIAIQLHNPFDTPINITQERITPGGSPYYFEIAGRFFDLDGFRMIDSGGGDPIMPDLSRSADIKGSEPITIPAGQSRTFVILNGTLEQIQGRMRRVKQADSPVPTGVGVIGRFLRQNLASGASGGRMNLVICEPIPGDPAQPMLNFPGDPGNPQPAAYQQPDTFNGFFDLLAGIDGAPLDEVRLWRAKVAEERDEDGEVIAHTDVPGSVGVNLRANDYLADRFRLPGDDRLDDPRLTIRDNGTTSAPTTIAGGRISEAWGIFDRQQTTSFLGVPNYNRGVTIMSFDAWRRRSDPNAPAGAWPAYCFEDPDGTLNTRADRPSGVASIRTGNLSASDFPSPPTRSSTRATTFLTFGDPETADPQSFLGTVLYDGESVPVAGVEQINNRFLRASQFRTDASDKTTNPIGSTPDGRSASEVRIEFSAGRLGNLRRPADLLLPLAVGASYTPDFSTATLNNPSFNDGDRWVTLSEALALSAGYADGLRGDHPARDLYQDAGAARPQPASTDLLVAGFDRPPVFLDRGQLVLDDFVPFVSSAPRAKTDDVVGPTRAIGDVIFGLGVPMALMIPEMVNAVPGYTGAGEVIPGTINVNTASRAVLRTIPMLSPSRDQHIGQQANSWWWGTIHDSRTDIATTLSAYRDKTRLLPRLEAGVSGALDDYFVDFSEFNEDGFGRLATAQIPGIRETRGLRTPGELGALRLRNRDNPGQPYTPGDQVQSRNSIDRLAAANQPITRYGVGSLPQIESVSALAGGYQSELLLANAAMNPTSVRSDYFAVWFLLHGYRRSDVENLSDTDPLVPSVARRFVMVVDRSNVIRPGDRPRIVLFREVPVLN